MLQQLMPIYEPLFSEDGFGCRPGRGAKDAIVRIKEYIEQGYTRAAVLDLSKYFDTLNHTMLLNLLRKQVKDENVNRMSGVVRGRRLVTAAYSIIRIIAPYNSSGFEQSESRVVPP